jgi:hypothetical protein
MRNFIAAPALLVAALLATGPVLAAVYSGESVAGVMNTTINSSNAYVGEPVTLTRVTSQNGSIAGATLYGQVTRVVKPGFGRKAQVQITFTRLRLANGTTYATDGIVTGIQVNTKSNALKEAGGAIAGMIVGNIIGKSIFHMSGGVPGFLGAAGGYLVAKNNRANVTVPAGSVVRVNLRSVRLQAYRR